MTFLWNKNVYFFCGKTQYLHRDLPVSWLYLNSHLLDIIM